MNRIPQSSNTSPSRRTTKEVPISNLLKPDNEPLNITESQKSFSLTFNSQSTSSDKKPNEKEKETATRIHSETIFRPFVNFLDTIGAHIVLTDFEGQITWYSESLNALSTKFFSQNVIGTKGYLKVQGSLQQMFSTIFENKLKAVELDLICPKPEKKFNWVIHIIGTRIVRGEDTGGYIWYLMCDKVPT